MIRLAARLLLTMVITAILVFGDTLVLTNQNESFAEKEHSTYTNHHTTLDQHYVNYSFHYK